MKTEPLYPYQERVNRFASGKTRVGLFVYIGGGKTYLSLHWLESLLETRTPNEVYPCFIFVQRHLITQWGDELDKHTDLVYSLVRGSLKQRVAALQRQAEVYIINYDAVRSKSVIQTIARMKPKSIIVDESTNLKESRTLRFKLLRKLTREVPYRTILTGKPITEDPINIWSQMLFLDDGKALGTSFWKFRYTYFTPGPPWRPYEWDLKPGAAEDIARRLNIDCIQIKKSEIASELPPKVYNIVHLPMEKKVRKMYNELKKDFQLELPSGTLFETQWAMVKGGKLHQLSQGFMYTTGGDYEIVDDTKLDWVAENLPLMLYNGPVLIWVSFLALIDRVSILLNKMKIPFSVHKGGMTDAEQDSAKAAFKKGDVDVLLLTEQSAARGLNLQRANQVIYISTDFKADLREQSEDRCHRLGSEIHEDITYYDLITEKSIDGVVWEAIREKQSVAESILKHIREE